MTTGFVLLVVFGGLVLLMLMGMPVAFAFLSVNVAAFWLLMGASAGPNQLAFNIFDGMMHFAMVPIPLFILMGELLYHSGIASRTITAIAKWLGVIPGRLSILAILSGTLFAALSGSVIANTAMMGSLLAPEMREHGYSKKMITGPILASGSLAMLIPPSLLAVLLGSLGNISIGKLLIATIIPGLLIATGAIGYIMYHCWRHPESAPAYQVGSVSWRERLLSLTADILPPGAVIVVVVGLIFLGVATPTQAAALGALCSLLLAAYYRRLTLPVLRTALFNTARTSGMIFMVVAGAAGFSQVLAFSGVTMQITQWVQQAPIPPLAILIAMQLVILVMGCFMEHVSIMMITLPVFIPVITLLGFDPVWFGVLMLINLDAGNLTPPFGLQLFVMKSVLPKEFSFSDIVRGAMPFFVLELAVIALIMVFPPLATWLPELARGV